MNYFVHYLLTFWIEKIFVLVILSEKIPINTVMFEYHSTNKYFGTNVLCSSILMEKGVFIFYKKKKGRIPNLITYLLWSEYKGFLNNEIWILF